MRRRAIESLGFSGRPEVPDLIKTAYKQKDTDWVESALFAMGRSADQVWQNDIISMFDHAKPSVQSEAIQAAGQPAVTALPKLSICLVDTIAGTIGLEMRHLELTFYHQPLQLRDGLCGVQSLRADLRAVRDGVAAVELEWI